MKSMKHMGTKRIIYVLTIVSSIVFFLSACAPMINSQYDIKEIADREIDNTDIKLTSETDVNFFNNEETFVINNTLEEILERLENANNGDRLGRIDGQEIFAFKYPQLTNRIILYSESNIPVRYDDYLAVRYDPEKNNEEYILLVYYFNSENQWDSWYKYIVAKNVKEAGIIAEEEIKNGYTVWTAENIVMEGEQFSETNTSESDFLVSFENDIIHLKK